MTFTRPDYQKRHFFRKHSAHFVCILLFTFAPTLAHTQPTETDLIHEMSRHLVCFPMERVSLQDSEITLDQKELCLATVYSETGPQPLWVTVNGPTVNAEIILEFLRNSYQHGLDPSDYNIDSLTELWPTDNAEELAQLDTTLTYSLLKYVNDVGHGQLKPAEEVTDQFPEVGMNEFDPLKNIRIILAANDLRQLLASLPPQHRHYKNLQVALEKYRQLATSGGWPQIAEGPSIRLNDRDLRCSTIRERLLVTGDLLEEYVPADPTSYDAQLMEAVTVFQKRHGLTPDGILGKKTLAAMNITADEKVNTISINMTRWRWQSHDLGAKHILVNIASFNLKAYEADADEPHLDIPVIVGEEQHQTPVFSDAIVYLDFNPFWNITPSIAENEELPALRKDPQHLINRNIRLFSSWQSDAVELDSTIIDWESITRGKMRGYKLRQDPGPWNALGKVKFVFPNRYSVYMHDTASPGLFKRTRRNFSHGCIRVSDPLALAIFVLNGQDGGWNSEKVVETYNLDSRKVVRLSQSIPVHITYLTTWVDKDGSINFNGDVYARDKKLINALLN